MIINDGSNALLLPGTITGASGTLTGGSIGIAGTLNVTNAASLTANVTGISETGMLTAATLTGSAITTAGFTGSNAVPTLAVFTTGSGFTLDDETALTVVAAIAGGTGAVLINDGANALLVPGVITGASSTLTGGSIGIAGMLNVTNTASLTANATAVSETGVLTAATLTGSAVTTASFAGVNTVPTLAAFTTGAGFTLASDVSALTVSGAVTGGTGAVVLNDGVNTLLVPGTITGASSTLTGGSIGIAGTLNVIDTALLTANASGITETGTLTAATLTGSAVSTAGFTGSNTIPTLAAFTTGSGFTLDDGLALTVTGVVAGGTGAVVLNDGVNALLVPGTITGASSTLTGGSIGIAGALNVAGIASLTANVTGITESGELDAATLTGSAVSTAGFTGSNSVPTLAAFATGSGFTLNDGLALTVTGAVAGGTGAVVLNDGVNALLVPGTITGASSTLTGGSIGIAGILNVTNTASLTANGSGITGTGILTAATLTGSAVTTAGFTGSNAIPTLAAFATGSGFTLNDGTALTVNGPIAGGAGAVVINDGSNALLLPGTITGASATLTGGSIGIGGMLNVTDTALLTANATSISATGVVEAATLTGSAVTIASFTGLNIIPTLAAFTTGSGFTLNDGTALTVTGAVAGGTGAAIIEDGANALLVPGAITGASSTLTGGSIGIAGTLNVTDTASLTANATAISETGVLTAATLAGQAATAANFAGVNTVSALADFSTGTGFTLASNVGALTVAGAVSGGTGAVVIHDGTNALLIPGTITGAAATLTGGSIGIAGTLAVTNAASLTANATEIDETGALDAAKLTGSTVTSASFTGSNSLPTLGAFTTGSGFSLNDNIALIVTGAVSGGTGAVAINYGSNALLVPGTITGAAATLTGGSIGIAGTLDVTGTALLTANVAGISETGTLHAATLTGSAATAASFTGSNTIPTLAAFSTGSGFTLSDATVLTVTGAVAGGTGAVTIDNGGNALLLPGTITGAAATLIGGSIGMTGTLNVTNTASLTANAAGISETGELDAAILTGSAVTTAGFTGSNTIPTLAAFTTGSGFTLNDGSALIVTSLVGGGSGAVVLNDGSNSLLVAGTITGAAGTLVGGSIGIAGALNVANTALLTANATAITETGLLDAATLTGSAVTTAGFTGSNSIPTLAAFATGTGFTLNDGSDLTVSGAVSGGTGAVTIDDGSNALSIPGSITAASATLSGGSIGITGLVNVPGLATFTATSGAITDTGILDAGTLTGSAATNSSFTGNNSISTLSNFTDFMLIDGTALTVAGVITAGTGPVIIDDGRNALTITGAITGGSATFSAGSILIAGTLAVANTAFLTAATGDITETGVLDAGTLAGSAATTAGFTGSNAIGTLANLAAPGSITLADTAPLVISGLVTTGGSFTLDAGANAIAIPGQIIAGSATVSSGSIGIAGGLSVAGTTSLTAANGSISETGALAAALLTGSAATNASFAGNNSIAALGSFTAAAGSLTIADVNDLSVSGSLLADSISITSAGSLTVAGNMTVALQSGTLALTANAISLASPTLAAATMQIRSENAIVIANGTTLATGGDLFVRPLVDLPPVYPGSSTVGAHLYAGSGGIQQTGTLVVRSYIAPKSGAAVATTKPELDLTLTSGTGVIAFDPNTGLVAPATSLLLNLGAGTVSGNVDADVIGLFYTQATTISTKLFGTLRTADGLDAGAISSASEAFIARNGAYVPSGNYQINNCAFSSLHCVLPTSLQQVPILSPFRDFQFSPFSETLNDPDLLLPNVSDENY